nr:uncharacterized protein LOC115115807 [Oncorhynchus nerka]
MVLSVLTILTVLSVLTILTVLSVLTILMVLSVLTILTVLSVLTVLTVVTVWSVLTGLTVWSVLTGLTVLFGSEYAEVEAHSEGLLADSDIVFAKETVPSQRLEPGGGHSQHQGQSITTSHSQGHQARGHQGHQARGHQAQEQGQVSTITNISLEEQKVLLSLNRLNRRLQYVQASAGGSPADKAFLRGEAPFTEEGTGAAQRKHRTVSTDNRPRTQRRF